MASHLTFAERQFLYLLKKKGKSNTEIANLIGRHRSTVCRELNRNTGRRGYRPQQAQRLADERRLASRRPHKMDDPNVHQYVQQKLQQYWSPDQIAGRVERDFPRAPNAGCRIKRFMIGFTSNSRSGSRCCVVVAGSRKSEEN